MKIWRRQKRNNKGRLTYALLISVPSSLAYAAEWTIQPLLEIAETYSDNIRLAPSGLEEDDFVTEINPGLLVRGAGRRLTLDLGYRLQNLLYANNSDSNSTNHQLFANAAAELLREHLFLDARASVGQENFSDLGSRQSDNLSLAGDRGDVITYSVSPYWRQRFRDLAEAQVRFTYDDVSGQSDVVSGSSVAVRASLTSGTRFDRWGWGLNYDRRDVSDEVEDGGDNRVNSAGGPNFETFEGQLSYRLTRQFGVFAAGGFENNDFASVNQDTDSITWRIGGNWRPSRNTELEAFYGNRFFGSTWGMDFVHRARRTTWSANYREAAVQTRNLLLDRALFALADTPQLITNPIATDQVEEEELVQFSGNLPTFSNEVFIDKTFTGGVDIDFRRMTLSLRGFNTTREFQQSGGEEDQVGALVVLSRNLSRATTAIASVQGQRIDFNNIGQTNRQDDTVDFRIGILHQFGRHLSGIIDYRFLDRSSSEQGSEFTENRIMGRLLVTL